MLYHNIKKEFNKKLNNNNFNNNNKKRFNKKNRLKEEDFRIYNNILYCIKNKNINLLLKIYKIEKIYKIMSGFHGKLNREMYLKYINIILYEFIKYEKYNILSYIINNEIKQHNIEEWDKYIDNINNEKIINNKKYLIKLTGNLYDSYYNGFISFVSLFSPFSFINMIL